MSEPQVFDFGPGGPRVEIYAEGHVVLYLCCANIHCNKRFNPKGSEYQFFCSPACFEVDEATCTYCHPELEQSDE